MLAEQYYAFSIDFIIMVIFRNDNVNGSQTAVDDDGLIEVSRKLDITSG